MAAPVPPNEEHRLKILAGCGVLDSDAEAAFDDIVELARHICETPIALVSLVDRDRQWFKARIGMDAPQTSRDVSFCAHAVAADAMLVVEDATADARFRHNPLVTGEPNIRFYQGVPIRLEGATVGTLCVLDRAPRKLTDRQTGALEALARRVEREILLRRGATTTVDRTKPPVVKPKDVGELAPGDLVLGRYRVQTQIGRGGMGNVFAAADTTTGDPVAIKVLARFAAFPTTVERFVREGLALRHVVHPNVARIHDAGNLDDGAPCLVMERCDGTVGSVAPGTAVRDVVALVRQAALGAAAVHEAGIVHRDLKPGNLLVVESQRGPVVKVADFGIAKLSARHLGAPSSVTSEADVIGSPHYMSPEQMLASRDVGFAADVWSLGVVLFELLTGTVPFEGDMHTICTQVFTGGPPSARERRPDVPDDVDAVIRRCLQRDARDRYVDGAALAAALAAL